MDIQLGLTLVSPKHGTGKVVFVRTTGRGRLYTVQYRAGYGSYYTDRLLSGEFQFGPVETVSFAEQVDALNHVGPTVVTPMPPQPTPMPPHVNPFAVSSVWKYEPTKDTRPYCVIFVDFYRRAKIRVDRQSQI